MACCMILASSCRKTSSEIFRSVSYTHLALTIGQNLENDRDVLKILTSYRRVAGKDFGAELDLSLIHI